MIIGKVVKRKKGFTLIELLVVTAIIGVLSVVSAQIVLTILESQDRTQVINEVRQNGDQAINMFERDVRAASTIWGGPNIIGLEDAAADGSDVFWSCHDVGLRRNLVLVTSEDTVTGVEVDNPTSIPSTDSCIFEFTSVANAVRQTVRWRFQLRPTRDDMQDVTVPFDTTVSTRR